MIRTSMATGMAPSSHTQQGSVATFARKSWFYPAVAAVVLLAFTAISVVNALTRAPWCDEAWLAIPSYNLIFHGNMGTTIWDGTGWFFEGIDRYSYNGPPLFWLIQAVWYKIVGFGLIAARMSSLAWGLVVLASFFVILRKLGAATGVALLGCSLIAMDYVFLVAASFARADMMAAGFCFAAVAAYLTWHKDRLNLAVFASQTCAVCSGFVHPNGGILSVASLVLCVLYFDRRRIRIRHFALAAIPYLVAAGGWSIYIFKDFPLFQRMFIHGALAERERTAFSILGSIRTEIVNRYLLAFGLGAHSAGNSGPIRLKAVALAAYVIGLAGALVTPAIRKSLPGRFMLLNLALYLAYFTFTEQTRQTYYLLYTLPLFAVLLALWTSWCWENRKLPRWLIAVGLAGMVTVEAGGVVYRAHLNTYSRDYLPVALHVKNLMAANPAVSVIGTADLAFVTGFDSNLHDDSFLGFYSKRKPDYIVMESRYEGLQAVDKLRRPGFADFLQRRLTEEYKVIYTHADYEIYARR